MSCLLSKIYINLIFPNTSLVEYVYVINHVNKSTHAVIYSNSQQVYNHVRPPSEGALWYP